MPVETHTPLPSAGPVTGPAFVTANGAPRAEAKLPKLGRAAQGGRISVITTIFMVLFHIGIHVVTLVMI